MNFNNPFEQRFVNEWMSYLQANNGVLRFISPGNPYRTQVLNITGYLNTHSNATATMDGILNALMGSYQNDHDNYDDDLFAFNNNVNELREHVEENLTSLSHEHAITQNVANYANNMAILNNIVNNANNNANYIHNLRENNIDPNIRYQR